MTLGSDYAKEVYNLTGGLQAVYEVFVSPMAYEVVTVSGKGIDPVSSTFQAGGSFSKIPVDDFSEAVVSEVRELPSKVVHFFEV